MKKRMKLIITDYFDIDRFIRERGEKVLEKKRTKNEPLGEVQEMVQ